MNILMLGWELPPHNSGGLGIACYHMSKALAQNGASIDFVVPYTAKHEGIDFMNVHGATSLDPLDRYGLNAYNSRAFSSETSGNDEASLKDMRSVQKHYGDFVEELLDRVDTPDVIHAHDWLTMEAGMKAKEITGKPLIVHVHATEFDRSGSDYGNPLVHDIEYQGLMMADRILAVSNFTKDIIVEKYHIPAEKVEVVYNAIDLNDFDDGYEYDKSTYTYLEALKNEGYTVISSLSRFTIQKGLPYLIRAVAKANQKYDKLALILAGEGEQRDELISLASELGISDKVFFTGFVRGKQWRDAYSVSDVFVMSSVSEPFGLTALEAAHHENALIISKQSGVGEVLHNIFRYDFWDTDKLADQLVGLATSDTLKNELKQNVLNEYDRLSWNDVANHCLSVYNHIKPKALAR